mmetsp:Transcript_4506/g.17042  ORF Transcript_4506/g.17042 Transcript_4506/m.17042 type:complete len:116 (+) Transcript_4506:662-1009(+)
MIALLQSRGTTTPQMQHKGRTLPSSTLTEEYHVGLLHPPKAYTQVGAQKMKPSTTLHYLSGICEIIQEGWPPPSSTTNSMVTKSGAQDNGGARNQERDGPEIRARIHHIFREKSL